MAAVDAKTLLDLMVAMDGESAVHTILQVLQARPDVCPAVIGFACPALTYAPAKGMMERRCRGVLTSFDQAEGFGYIASPEIEAVFGMDAIVTQKQVGAFTIGEEVSFTCVLAEGNRPQAVELLTAFGLPRLGLPGVAAAGSASAPGWADWNSWGSAASTGDLPGDSDAKRRKMEAEGPAIGEYAGPSFHQLS
eukprot:TRINITY_DN18624_c0_g1_i1.p1 TRINITY_DN18624_c0_g1~~TRINITY_DN18624_c0_g1_i1.p1  ORF type:complete len:223 (+),score=52.66 TRINITY_DN18624_c0_g1_i1:92-670(+)